MSFFIFYLCLYLLCALGHSGVTMHQCADRMLICEISGAPPSIVVQRVLVLGSRKGGLKGTRVGGGVAVNTGFAATSHFEGIVVATRPRNGTQLRNNSGALTLT